MAQWQSGRVAGSSEAGGDRGREAGGLGGRVGVPHSSIVASIICKSVEESVWRGTTWQNDTEAG